MSILLVIKMEESGNDKQLYQEINHITFGKRSVFRFLAFGWIITGIFGLLVVANPAILLVYLAIALADRIYYLITKKELTFLSKFGKFLSKTCFGASHEYEGNIRVWWTFLLGFYIFDILVVLFVLTSWLVVPVILLIAHRENVLKGLYTLIFLPRNSKIVNPYWEEKKRKQALKDDELLADWQETYMYQLGPDRTSNIVAVSSFIIAGGIIYSFISFIPNLILSLFRKYRLSRVMSEKMTPKVASFFQSDFFRMLGGLPFLNFSGDWYIEKNSRVMNYTGANGFVNAFSGKWSDLIIYPLAVSSIALLFFARNKDFADIDEAFKFILEVAILLAFVSALVFHLVFPVLWTLDDASIMNVSFSKGYYGSRERTNEISQVTDVGKRIRQLISFFLGASTILNLSLFFTTIEESESSFDILGLSVDKLFYRYFYLLGAVIFMWILVVPGIMLSAYIYLTQDHIANVNELRYNSSKSPWIAVGTLETNYKFNEVLPPLIKSSENLNLEASNESIEQPDTLIQNEEDGLVE
ncbi:MAG: hypothetical protein ACTSYA_12350 [Candidatus Kariarchaeaceae archaeon]